MDRNLMGYGGKLSDNLRQARNVGGRSYRVCIATEHQVIAVVPLMAMREIDLLRPVEHIIGGYVKEQGHEGITATLCRRDDDVWKELRRCIMAGDEVIWESVN